MTNKKNNIYCVYCGTGNILEDKKCSKCKKELNPKNRPFRDYLKEKIQDKLEGDIQDNILSIMINFVKTHLYGSILTCSIVITAVSVVTNLVNNSNDFEEVKERPNIVQKYEYAGEGLNAEEVTRKYADALDSGDLKTIKSLELGTFYPEVLKELEGSTSIPNDMYGSTTFFSTHDIFDNRETLFKMEKGFNIGFSFGVVPEGRYGEYNFFRHPIFITYCFENNCDKENNIFYASIAVEVIEVEGNYYVSGSKKEVSMSIGQEIEYKFLLDNKGDVSKFSQQDIDDYILSLE